MQPACATHTLASSASTADRSSGASSCRLPFSSELPLFGIALPTNPRDTTESPQRGASISELARRGARWDVLGGCS